MVDSLIFKTIDTDLDGTINKLDFNPLPPGGGRQFFDSS